MNAVDAVKTDSQREQVEYLLGERGRIYLDIWKLGVNVALRISDLLALTMEQVRNLDPDNPAIKVVEIKTGKARTLTLNAGALDIVRQRLTDYPLDTWLFQSGSPKHAPIEPKAITRRSVARVFESIGKQVTPAVQLSTHSMRKTRGYVMHARGYAIEEISRVLNHSHPAVTMAYIGLTDAAVQQTYSDIVH